MNLDQFPRMTESEATRLEDSDIWISVKKEIEYRIMSLLLSLKNSPDVKSIQNKIKAFEEILALPEGVKEREQQQKESK